MTLLIFSCLYSMCKKQRAKKQRNIPVEMQTITSTTTTKNNTNNIIIGTDPKDDNSKDPNTKTVLKDQPSSMMMMTVDDVMRAIKKDTSDIRKSMETRHNAAKNVLEEENKKLAEENKDLKKQLESQEEEVKRLRGIILGLYSGECNSSSIV
jgi:hypothetical protein